MIFWKDLLIEALQKFFHAREKYHRDDHHLEDVSLIVLLEAIQRFKFLYLALRWKRSTYSHIVILNIIKGIFGIHTAYYIKSAKWTKHILVFRYYSQDIYLKYMSHINQCEQRQELNENFNDAYVLNINT